MKYLESFLGHFLAALVSLCIGAGITFLASVPFLLAYYYGTTLFAVGSMWGIIAHVWFVIYVASKLLKGLFIIPTMLFKGFRSGDLDVDALASAGVLAKAYILWIGLRSLAIHNLSLEDELDA